LGIVKEDVCLLVLTEEDMMVLKKMNCPVPVPGGGVKRLPRYSQGKMK